MPGMGNETDTACHHEAPQDLHSCRCCGEALPWSEYEPIGVQDLTEYGIPLLQLANCPQCHSTASREVAS